MTPGGPRSPQLLTNWSWSSLLRLDAAELALCGLPEVASRVRWVCDTQQDAARSRTLYCVPSLACPTCPPLKSVIYIEILVLGSDSREFQLKTDSCNPHTYTDI